MHTKKTTIARALSVALVLSVMAGPCLLIFTSSNQTASADPRITDHGNYTSTIHWDFENPSNYTTVNVNLSNQEARLISGEDSWQQTAREDFENGTFDNTVTTTDGRIILSNLTGNSIANGDFSTPDNWTYLDSMEGNILAQWSGGDAWMSHPQTINPLHIQNASVGDDVQGDGSTNPPFVPFTESLRTRNDIYYHADAGEYLLINGFNVTNINGQIDRVELWAEFKVEPFKYEGQDSLRCRDVNGTFQRTDIIPKYELTSDTVRSQDITHLYPSWDTTVLSNLQVRFLNSDPAPFAWVEFDSIWLEVHMSPMDETAYAYQTFNRGARIGHTDTRYFDFIAGRTKTDIDIWTDQGNVLLSSTGSRQTVVYQQAALNGKDAHIVDGPNSKTNYGGAQRLEMTTISSEKRTLIQFDITAIPGSAWVESAYLYLKLNLSNGLDVNVSFYRVTTAWNEMLVTWEDPWISFGGDFNGTPVATTVVKHSYGQEALVGWNLTDIVRAWGAGAHSQVYSNYGLIGIIQGATLTNDKSFHSSESASTNDVPQLVVTFSDLSYVPSGVFESRIFDAGRNVTWDGVFWTETTMPGTTSLRVKTRTGSMPDYLLNPEAWGSWEPSSGYVNPGDPIISSPGRYIQYRVEFYTNHQNYTPVLSDLLMLWEDVKLNFDYIVDDLVNIDLATLEIQVDDTVIWSANPGLMGGWGQAEVDIARYLFDDQSHKLALGFSLFADNDGLTRAGGRYDNVRISGSLDGEYLSPILGSGVSMDWLRISWIETAPVGTAIEIMTRVGDSSYPDATWTPWSLPYTVSPGDPLTHPDSCYIQYKLTLSTTDSFIMPEVHEVTLWFEAYRTWGKVESLTFTAPNVIQWGVFNADELVSPGSDIRYYYSTNNGTNWFEMFPGFNMSSVAIPNIKVKAELMTLPNASTPILYEMNLTYMHLEPLHHIDMSLVSWSGTADSVLNLDALGYDKYGKLVGFQQFWSTTDPNGTVDSTGLYNPGSVGNWRVYCNNSDNSISNFTSVSVSPGQMVKVGVTPWQLGTITTDNNITFNAFGFDADGNSVSQAIVNWSLTSGIGIIDSGPSTTAVFNPTMPGSARVIADDGRGHINVTNPITVVPGIPVGVAVTPYDPGTITTDDTVLFTAYGKDRDGNTVSNVPVNWSVMGGIGSVPPGPNSSIVFDPTSVGNGKIAVDDGLGHTNSTATFTVLAGAVASIQINPSWTEVEPGGEVNFTATAEDADGNQATMVTTLWTTNIGNIAQATSTSATLEAQGTEGTGWVNATHGAVTGSATVNVVEGLLSPSIQGTVPSQTRPEDYGSWSLDLSGFASDPNEPIGTLMWNLKNSNPSLYTVSGLNIAGNHILVFTTVQDAYGSNQARLELINSQGYSDSQQIWINITPVNDPPIFSGAPNLFVRYDEPYVFDYSPYIFDIDNSLSDFTLTTDDPVNTTVTGLNVTYNYPESMVGQTAYVRITARDNAGGTDSDLISIRVSSNYPPTLVKLLPDVEIFEGQTKKDIFDLDDYIVDPDADSLFFSLGYTHLTIQIDSNHKVTITAEDQWTGVESVTFRAVDPVGGMVEDTIKVTVIGVNDPPMIKNVPPFVIRYEYPYTFNLEPYISDVDNDLAELVVTTSNPNNVTVNGHKITLVYPEYWAGNPYPYSVPLTIWVSDGTNSSFQVVMVTVGDNYPPEVLDPLPDLTFNEDFQLEYAFDLDDYFRDVDSDTLFFVSGQEILVVTIFDNHTVTFEAPQDWFGVELVTFRAIDAGGAIVEDSIKVEVRPVNDPPVVLTLPNQYVDYRQWTFDLTSYLSDVDNDIYMLNITTNSPYVWEDSLILFFDYPEGVHRENVTITVSDGLSNTTSYMLVVIIGDEPSDWITSNWPWLLVLVVGLLASLGTGGYLFFRKSMTIEDLFLIHRNGMLIEHHTRRLKVTVDHDILSGMLTAIQEFTRETFMYGDEGGLKKMDLGDRSIFLGRGDFVTLALVVRGEEPEDMSEGMGRLIADIEERYPEIEYWDGTVGAFKGLPEMLGAYVKGSYDKGFWRTGSNRLKAAVSERKKGNQNSKSKKNSKSEKTKKSGKSKDSGKNGRPERIKKRKDKKKGDI